jgi:hypothetical protein
MFPLLSWFRQLSVLTGIRLLRSYGFKNEIAGAMALAAGECLSVDPAALHAIQAKTVEAGAWGRAYRVQRGDTLHGIAKKQPGIPPFATPEFTISASFPGP